MNVNQLWQNYKPNPGESVTPNEGKMDEERPISFKNNTFHELDGNKNIEGSNPFVTQYNHLYFNRLKMLRPVLEEKAKKANLAVFRVNELDDINHEATVIGTFYREVKNKVSFLKVIESP